MNTSELRADRMTAGRVALLVVGAVAALVGVGLTLGGGVLVWAHATQRDDAGFYTSGTERFSTSTAALTSNVDLGEAPGRRDWTFEHGVGTVRLRVDSTADESIFVGIAPEDEVDRWLAGVGYEEITRPNFGPRHERSTVVPGGAAEPPASADFWAASASGAGRQTLLWPSEGGDWTIVVMNADGRPGVAADVSVGARTGVLLPIGFGLAAAGLLVLLAAAELLFLGLRHQVSPVVEVDAADMHTAPALSAVPSSASYPARLDGRLDEGVSRWQWLFKWLLALPHLVALVFLWLAAAVLTVVAGVAILFTGRYPRAIFDFNVGVMRWSWRVGFYTVSAFATDRYPPFSLAPDPSYPADFTVDYAVRLSRGLVLVKWWLLAIPHLLIVSVLAGGWGLGSDTWRVAGSGGLISLLAIVSAGILAVTGRYPQAMFDFLMGLNRWCFRVLAYVALLRDEYPPFRLDTGGTDPGTPGFDRRQEPTALSPESARAPSSI